MNLDSPLSGFLVRIDVARPADKPADRRAELLTAERARGVELIQLGYRRNNWRIPGRHANRLDLRGPRPDTGPRAPCDTPSRAVDFRRRRPARDALPDDLKAK